MSAWTRRVFLQGQQYVSLMTDLAGARVLEVVPDRPREAADARWAAVPAPVRTNIAAVTMDMWEAFLTSTRTQAPPAAIVHDKFHITKYLTEAVDHVRRTEHKLLMRAGDETLTGTKYLFLKRPEHMSETEQPRFAALRLDTLKAGRAWALKETFADFWHYTSATPATKFFTRWYWWATHSRLRPMIDVAKTIKRHFANILTYLAHRITNAVTEGVNAKIQSLKANARGYRNFGNYRTAILFTCGKLDLYP